MADTAYYHLSFQRIGGLGQGMNLFGTGLSRICAVAAASTAVEMSRLVRSALRQVSTIELRLDWLRSDSERTRFLAWLLKYKPRNATFIATFRPRECG